MPIVAVNYKRIHYRDVGPKNGGEARGTIMLVHGLGSSQNFYTAVIPRLVEQNYRCLALDTTGSGRSPYTFVEQSISSLARDLIDFMDALHITSAVVVAHSMGGLTAPQAAALAPERISALVLLGPVFPSSDATTLFEQRIAAIEKSGMEAVADVVPFAAIGSKATALHSAFIRELMMSGDPSGYISLCRVIAGGYKSPPAFAKVACPVLIIAGAEDKSAPVAGCEKLLAAVNSSEKRMVVLDGIGHWLAVEAPTEVAEETLKFLEHIK